MQIKNVIIFQLKCLFLLSITSVAYRRAFGIIGLVSEDIRVKMLKAFLLLVYLVFLFKVFNCNFKIINMLCNLYLLVF